MEFEFEKLAAEALKLSLPERAELAQRLLASLDEDNDVDIDIDIDIDEAHTGWMKQQLAESLADPSPNFSHELVMADVQAVIDAKRNQRSSEQQRGSAAARGCADIRTRPQH